MDNLEYIRKQIVKHVLTPMEAHNLVLELIKEDWESVFKRLEIERIGKTCARCKRKTIPHSDQRIIVSEKRIYCEECLNTIQGLHTVYCRLCKKEYIVAKVPPPKGFSPVSLLGLCPECRMADIKSIAIHLKNHVNISRSKQQPSSLSLEEWMKIIRDFNGMCAYCLIRPYEVLEHFRPNMGTTRYNCVPACTGCNSVKWGYNPDEFVWKNREFNDAIARVRVFLAHARN